MDSSSYRSLNAPVLQAWVLFLPRSPESVRGTICARPRELTLEAKLLRLAKKFSICSRTVVFVRIVPADVLRQNDPASASLVVRTSLQRDDTCGLCVCAFTALPTHDGIAMELGPHTNIVRSGCVNNKRWKCLGICISVPLT